MINGESSYLRFLDGDESGMVEIIDEYKNGLTLYLCGITGDVYAAEDVMEETFYRLFRKKPKYSPKASFKTWLYTIARNEAITYLRRRARKNEICIDEAEAETETAAVEREFFENERAVTLYRAMQRLNADYRQILWLSYFDDLSNEQISKIMKKSARQTETMLYRARKKLKDELLSEGFVYEDYC